MRIKELARKEIGLSLPGHHGPDFASISCQLIGSLIFDYFFQITDNLRVGSFQVPVEAIQSAESRLTCSDRVIAFSI
jgi:hypothetical protein